MFGGSSTRTSGSGLSVFGAAMHFRRCPGNRRQEFLNFVTASERMRHTDPSTNYGQKGKHDQGNNHHHRRFVRFASVIAMACRGRVCNRVMSANRCRVSMSRMLRAFGLGTAELSEE